MASKALLSEIDRLLLYGSQHNQVLDIVEAAEHDVIDQIARYLEGEALSLGGQVRDASELLRGYARTIRAGGAK